MSLGSGEIFIIVILALLLFGPDKLPELARQAARVFRDVRRAADEVKSQFNLLGDDEDDEPRRPLASMRDKINERDDGESDEKNATSSTRSDEADDPYAHRYGEEISDDDTYFINNENGGAPDDNDWRHGKAENDALNGEMWKPTTLETSRVDFSQNSTDNAQSNNTQTADVDNHNLELRVTPTTSVARNAAPNRVRVEDDSVKSNEPRA